jgi:hypothetical protein
VIKKVRWNAKMTGEAFKRGFGVRSTANIESEISRHGAGRRLPSIINPPICSINEIEVPNFFKPSFYILARIPPIA